MIELRNVQISYYGEKSATLNLAMPKGIVMILGQYGSYKTTVLRIIAGLKIIDSGEVFIDGVEVGDVHPKLRDIALVGEDSWIKGKVKNLLEIPLKLRKVSKKDRMIAIKEAAEKYKLDLHINIESVDKIAFYSARLWLRKPRLVLFDEPYHFLGNATDLIKSTKNAIVTSSDALDIYKLNPDYLVIMRGNEVLQQGKTNDVLACPASEYVKQFLLI